MNKLIISVFYVGFLPVAPGTFGSIFAVILGIILQSIGGFPLLIVSIFLIYLLGWSATNIYTSTDNHDPKEVVIDEVVGQLCSYTPFSFYIWIFNAENFFSTFWDWLIAFALFRIFDILKPWPINLADNIESASGVMLDDIIAGLLTAILITGIILTFN